jgi:ATP-dependent DNA helicase RecG
MHTQPEEFAVLLATPEGQHVEFKEAKSDYRFEKLLEYCVALANEGGGKIVLGVTDRRPREVVGTTAFAEPGRTEAGICQRLHQRIPVEEYHHDGKRVLIVHVPARLAGVPWEIDGRYLKRAGDALVALPPAELRSIFAEAGPDFTAQSSPAPLEALAPAHVAEFRRRWARKVGNPRIEQWGDEELLVNAELLVDGRPCYAALILFGTRESLGRYLAQAEIVFEYRSSEAAAPAQDRAEYRDGFFGYHDALWQKINLRNDRQSYQDDFFRYDIPTFDEVAIREALLNAISHRDYTLGGSVFVRQYARRLEIVSPGGLPGGIARENIAERQNPRNRRLAEALAKAGLVERAGQGLDLMIATAVRQTKPLPDFAGSDAHQVHLTLAGTVQNPAFIRFLERLGDERLAKFNTADFLTLDALQRDQLLSPALKSRLFGLIEVGAVECQGRGKNARHFLSRDMYAAIGAPGVYTRRRGLDHETNKTLLEKHLRDTGAAGAPMSELVQVLPALSRAHIKRLLLQLEVERRAHLRGITKAARWFVGPSPKLAQLAHEPHPNEPIHGGAK